MNIKLGFIFVLLLILVESAIIFNAKQDHINDTVECFNIVEEKSKSLNIDEIIKELENCNVKLLNITNENGEYLISVSINEDKGSFVERIESLNNFIIKDYELGWKENMVDGTLLLKYSTINEL